MLTHSSPQAIWSNSRAKQPRPLLPVKRVAARCVYAAKQPRPLLPPSLLCLRRLMESEGRDCRVYAPSVQAHGSAPCLENRSIPWSPSLRPFTSRTDHSMAAASHRLLISSSLQGPSAQPPIPSRPLSAPMALCLRPSLLCRAHGPLPTPLSTVPCPWPFGPSCRSTRLAFSLAFSLALSLAFKLATRLPRSSRGRVSRVLWRTWRSETVTTRSTK